MKIGINMVDALTRVLNDFCLYIKYRWFNRFHIIRINSLEPGYYDTDTRLFHGAFDLLVQFVERELAWMQFIGGSKYNVPWWQTEKSYVKQHAEELAMDFFKEDIEMCEKDDENTHQAENDKEVREIYVWYKHTRPKRIDPTKYYWDHKDNPKALEKSSEIEAQQGQEDTDYFVRLVKIRGCLWT